MVGLKSQNPLIYVRTQFSPRIYQLLNFLFNSAVMIRSAFMQITQAVYKMSEVIVKNTSWGSITASQGRNNEDLNAGSHTKLKKESFKRDF